MITTFQYYYLVYGFMSILLEITIFGLIYGIILIVCNTDIGKRILGALISNLCILSMILINLLTKFII